MNQADWWRGASPVEAIVKCGGVGHRLIAEGGRLLAADHLDPAGEALLAALGAPPARCLRLVDLWAAHLTDVRALTLASCSSDDQPTVDLAAIDRLVPEFLPPPTRREAAGLAGLLPRYFDLRFPDRWQSWREALELLSLPAPLQVRWGATVAAHLLSLPPAATVSNGLDPALVADLRANPIVMTTRQVEQSAVGITRAILDTALYARSRRAVARWLGSGAEITFESLPPDGTPSFRQTPHGVHLALRHDWLVRVWGCQLAVVNDAFTLDAVLTDPATGTLHLTTHTGGTTIHRPQLQPTRAF